MAQREIQKLLEQAIDGLPDAFRLVLVARAVEGMSIEDTAELPAFGRRRSRRVFIAREHCSGQSWKKTSGLH